MPPHHHHNNKLPLGAEPMTSRTLSGCNTNWAKLSLPWGLKGPIFTLRGAEKRCGIEKRCHHHTTTKTPPQKHHHKNTTKHHHHKKTPQKHHHHENTTTPPPQKRHQPPQPCQLLSCLERRLKRCQRDVQMQEQPYLYVVKIVGDPPTMTIFAQPHTYGILHTVCDEIFRELPANTMICRRSFNLESCMWSDIWNDVKTTSSCEEQTLFETASTLRTPASGTAHSGHKQGRSAQCSLLGSTWNAMGGSKLCLVLRTGWAACGTPSKRRPGAGTLHMAIDNTTTLRREAS